MSKKSEKSAAKFGDVKFVMPGVTVRHGKRGRTVRFACMIDRIRYSKTCELPIDILLSGNDSPTRELKAEYGRWVAECSVGSRRQQGGMHVPSIKELIEAYKTIAWKRQGDPRFRKADRTIDTAVKNFGYCVEASGLRDDRPYKELMDFDTVRKIADRFVRDKEHGGKGLTSLSAWSYICSLQSVTAKWTIVYYRDRGLLVESQTIPKQSLFGISADPKQYEELPRETVEQIWDWYMGMSCGVPAAAQDGGEAQNGGRSSAEKCAAAYATCMLELAMRPKDIGELTAENFPLAPNGHHRLVYRPTKTRESSNRRVDIEIPDALYERLRTLCAEGFENGGLLVPRLRAAEATVNASLRKLPGLKDKQKASYELRKLCIHTILVTPVENGGGSDQAVKLSGDRRETIEKYYCDPYKSHTALPEAPLKAFLGR